MTPLLLRLTTMALLLSALTIGLWVGTGRHAYTAFESIEIVAHAPDDDDPFAATGLYDDAVPTSVRTTATFRLGLIPTPQHLFDRHLLSVLTLLPLSWAPAILLVLGRRVRAHRLRSVHQPLPM